MGTELDRELARLPLLSVAQLKARYAEVFGEETNGNHKTWLVRRIAWRLQALAEGDLSERARKRADELADDAYLRMGPPRVQSAAPAPQAPPPVVKEVKAVGDARLPPAGSILTRRYKGADLQVLVLPDGFEFRGQTYASLSAVAKAVTGSHCNGYLFFRLNGNGGER